MYWFLERGEEKEKDQFAVPPIRVFTGWFLYMPWPGHDPTTLVYWDNNLINWAIQPEPTQFILALLFIIALFSIRTTVNLLLSNPVYYLIYNILKGIYSSTQDQTQYFCSEQD